MRMYVPIAIIVVSNVFYHICSKSVPDSVNPFAALTVTYTVGAVLSAILYFVTNRSGSIIEEYKNLNWSTWILGLAIVGLEAGTVYMYKVGWNISTGQLVHGVILSICLIFVGALLYKEKITPTKIAGIAVCSIGLFLINK